jgi:hypothetical protein
MRPIKQKYPGVQEVWQSGQGYDAGATPSHSHMPKALEGVWDSVNNAKIIWRFSQNG